MANRFDTISFLSDYGHDDEFVGVVHSVIASINPGVRVIDISHSVEPFNVRAGGLTLARSSQYLVPGVVLAVVDPGVGTSRKGVAIEVGGGQSYLVGPDNGLLAPVVAMVGGATDAVVLDNPAYQLPPVGTTFDGRDVFAPAAAHLCAGVPLHELGTQIDAVSLMPGILPVAEEGPDGSIAAEVLWVDRYGNVQLNVDPEQLDGWPATVGVAGGDDERVATQVRTFAEIPPMTIGLLTDSYGLVALAVARGSASEALGLGETDGVTLRPVEGRAPDNLRSIETPVVFTTNPGPDHGGIR
ncbi:MAG: SAM-dependent chlorinase/fluorinase [Actinomycetota bacterium]